MHMLNVAETAWLTCTWYVTFKYRLFSGPKFVFTTRPHQISTNVAVCSLSAVGHCRPDG